MRPRCSPLHPGFAVRIAAKRDRLLDSRPCICGGHTRSIRLDFVAGAAQMLLDRSQALQNQD